ncbi:hypothetical protein A2U01_0094965, partial [Trifolium medium]|nr:hypothetical protein [Trifolium medium]
MQAPEEIKPKLTRDDAAAADA